MYDLEQLRNSEYLVRASPEAVFDWYKHNRRRTPDDVLNRHEISQAAEQQLLGRQNEIIDLALAAWGTHSETSVALFNRWCSRAAVSAWPPGPDTFARTILLALLANVDGPLHPWSDKLPPGEMDWLLEHGGPLDEFRAIHSNPATARGVLRGVAERVGVYGRLTDERWLSALHWLGYNEGLRVAESPDGYGWIRVHELIIRAATDCPKTYAGAVVLGDFLSSLRAKYTRHAKILISDLDRAVQSWNVEADSEGGRKYQIGVISDPESHVQYAHDEDGMTPSERVSFHLLRHYASRSPLDPNDASRAVRLAAYSRGRVIDGTRSGGGGELDGLDQRCFQKYAERDGPAFMFANSYNPHIWGSDLVIDSLRGGYGRFDFPIPKDRRALLQNRKRAAKAAKRAREKYAEEIVPHEKVIGATTALLAESEQRSLANHKDLVSLVASTKRWLIAAFVLLVLALVALSGHR